MTNLPNLPADPPKEPALAVGTTTGTLAGIVSLIVVLFPDMLTDKQVTTILVVATFVGPIISAIITRSRVFSPATVKELLDQGIADAQKITKPEKPLLRELGKPVLKSPDESDFFKKNDL